jgi:hypothetical protein
MNLAKAFPLVIALTVGRHAGTYPVHFQFPDDRQRAERDVSAISSLLDPLSKDFLTKRSRLTIRRPTISTAPFWLRRRKRGKACHFWKKAKNLGVVNADYWLGLSYVSVGEKAKAIENLENYTKRVPGDQNAARILDAVRHDNVKFDCA